MGRKHKKHKASWKPEGMDGFEKTPIKLVLKLGSEVMYDSDNVANSPASSIYDTSSHKHKKRKKKHRRDEYQEYADDFDQPVVSQVEGPASDQPEKDASPDASIIYQEEDSYDMSYKQPYKTFSDYQLSSTKDHITRPPLSFVKRQALNQLLEHLLKQLERKDPHEIFSLPVNDVIAPGYSSLIKEPMDFSAMRNKIITNQYYDVGEFKKDFQLMIDNCCLYNKPDTVYHDIAKKVSAAGTKIMSKERLINMKRTFPFLHDLTKQQLSEIFGMSIFNEETLEVVDTAATSPYVPLSEELVNDSFQESTQVLEAEEFDLRAHPDAISFTDADNEDTVAPDAIQAMKDAQKRLSVKCPNNRIGFLQMNDEGKTTLNLLNLVANEHPKREVDLSSITNDATSCIVKIHKSKEDESYKMSPLEYLGYGPFGSSAPTHDSSIANLTEEENNILSSAYGNDTGYLFAKSMENFVSNCNKTLIRLVGDLLDTVTHGAHSQAVQHIDKKRNTNESKHLNLKNEKLPTMDNININCTELESLKDLGIDVSFLKEVKLEQSSHQSK